MYAAIDSPPPVYRLSAPNSPSSPKVCRDTIAALLCANDLAHLVDTAKLLVSEAVTNITLHTSTYMIELDALVQDGSLLVTVRDDDPDQRPRVRTPANDEETGRGLLLVQALSSTWGVTWTGGSQPPGKRVWFELNGERDATT